MEDRGKMKNEKRKKVIRLRMLGAKDRFNSAGQILFLFEWLLEVFVYFTILDAIRLLI